MLAVTPSRLKIQHPMSTQTDEAPALTFAFQARRFACDRCHRYKLKCERGPLIMTAGIATPLGPCKRCGKAGVECTSSNATTSASSTRNETNTADSSSNITKNAQKRNSPKPASSSTGSSNDLGSFSPFGRPLFNNLESTLTDSALFLDTFDFDLGAVGGESGDHFNTPSAANPGLLSPDKSHTSGSTKELETAERTRYSVREDMGENGSAFSDSLNISPTESLTRSNDHSLPAAAEPMRPLSPLNPLMEALNKLSELQIFIFKEFGCISKENLARTFLSPGNESCQGLGSASQDTDLVGKVLYASERLIDILTSCGRNEPDLPSASSPLRSRSDNLSGSKRSYSNLLDEEELLQTDTSSSGSFRFSSPTADTLTTHLDFLRRTNANAPNGRPPSPPKSTSSARSDTPIYSGLLSPAKLMLLVCYVSLLGVYRSILIQAFEIVRTPLPPSPPSRSRIPRCGPFHTSTATPQSLSPQISSSTILRFRIQLEMFTHT